MARRRGPEDIHELLKAYQAEASAEDQTHRNSLADTISAQGTPERFSLRALQAPGGALPLLVVEEAAVTAECLGIATERIYDVGAAGIHRLFPFLDRIGTAAVVIVVAGMEGALPGILAGLTDRPVIAVPTSVGYGANFQGVAALLAMPNSCAAVSYTHLRAPETPEHLVCRLLLEKK